MNNKTRNSWHVSKVHWNFWKMLGRYLINQEWIFKINNPSKHCINWTAELWTTQNRSLLSLTWEKQRDKIIERKNKKKKKIKIKLLIKIQSPITVTEIEFLLTNTWPRTSKSCFMNWGLKLRRKNKSLPGLTTQNFLQGKMTRGEWYKLKQKKNNLYLQELGHSGKVCKLKIANHTVEKKNGKIEGEGVKLKIIRQHFFTHSRLKYSRLRYFWKP